MSSLTSSRRRAAAIAPVLISLATLVATAADQPAPRGPVSPFATDPNKRAEEREKIDPDVVRLNVFEVNTAGDDAYRAANTTAGTRYNTALKDLPMQVDVMTEAFIRDIGASDYREALEYISGVQLDQGNAGRDNPANETILIRGYGGSPLKNGFRRRLPADSVMMSRIDVLKGSAGPLYPAGADGGAVSFSSPRPTAKPTYRFMQRVGTENFYRAEARYLGPLWAGGRAGLALPTAYEYAESERQYYWTERFVINPSITIRITPKTTLLLDYERHQNDHSNTRDVWITDNGRAPNGDFYGIFYEGRNTGTNRVLATPDQRLFSFQGPDIYRKQRAHATVVRLDHAFTDDLQAWIGYSSQDYHVSERTWNIALRNWNANEIPLKVRTDPRFQALMRPAFAGQTPQVMDIRPNNESPDSVGRFPNIKSEIYYSFSTGPVKHTVIGGIEYGDLKILNTSTRYFYYGNSSQATNPATIAWENLPVDVILSRFRSPLDFTTVQRWNESVISQYPQGYTNGIGLPSAVSTSYFYDRNIYANLQSQYFNGKLQTIIGGTWQRSDRQTRVFDAEGRFLWASPAPAGAPAGVLTGIMRPEPVRALAPSVTAIWLPNSSIRFYGNAMSSTNPGNAYSSYDGAGKPMDAPIITNGELGFRAEFWKDRILFNFAYFRATREGLPRNIPIAFQNAVINPTSGAAYTSGFGANVATDDEAKGYEVKVDFVVNPSLRFNLSMTENKLQITKIDPFLAPAHPNPTFLAAQLAFLATGRDANSYIGTNPDDRSIHTATGFVRYEVKTGRLRGLWGFFGAKYLGHRESETVTLNTANDTISVSPNYVPSHYLFDFNAGYRHRVGRYGLEYQLNIANLLDDHKYYGGGWQSPRTIRVSAAINF